MPPFVGNVERAVHIAALRELDGDVDDDDAHDLPFLADYSTYVGICMHNESCRLSALTLVLDGVNVFRNYELIISIRSRAQSGARPSPTYGDV